MKSELEKYKTAETDGIVLDHAAKVYDILTPLMMFGTHKLEFKRTVLDLEIKKGDKILDLGCGTGTLSKYVAPFLDHNQGGEIVGVDASGKMIECADSKRIGDEAKFIVAAGEAMPFGNEYFDKATSLFFFHHVNLNLKRAAANELYRVLKPNAILIVTDISAPTNVIGRICLACGEWLFDQPEIGENKRGEHIRTLTDAGFEVVAEKTNWTGYVTRYKLLKRA